MAIHMIIKDASKTIQVANITLGPKGFLEFPLNLHTVVIKKCIRLQMSDCAQQQNKQSIYLCKGITIGLSMTN